MKKFWIGLLFFYSALVGGAQKHDANPARVALTVFGDSTLGYLTLGKSRTADAQRVLKEVGGLGPRNENTTTFAVGKAKLRPRVLYMPTPTMNQLFFDNDVLVLFVEGMPNGLPPTYEAFRKRFTQVREVYRDGGTYKVETQLSNCIWLTAVFFASNNELESVTYAYTCLKR